MDDKELELKCEFAGDCIMRLTKIYDELEASVKGIDKVHEVGADYDHVTRISKHIAHAWFDSEPNSTEVEELTKGLYDVVKKQNASPEYFAIHLEPNDPNCIVFEMHIKWGE